MANVSKAGVSTALLLDIADAEAVAIACGSYLWHSRTSGWTNARVLFLLERLYKQDIHEAGEILQSKEYEYMLQQIRETPQYKLLVKG